MTETLQALSALHQEMKAARLTSEQMLSKFNQAMDMMRQPKRETVIIGPAGYTFEAQGYPYNALIAADGLNGTDITIDERGQKYTYTLQAGWNVIDMSDGAYLTATSQLQMVLVRDMRELISTFGTRVSVVNPTGNPVNITGDVQLTGSNATKLTSDGTSTGLTPYIGSSLGSGDGNGTNALLLATGTYGLAYNETTWDRVRNNTQGTLLASAARTASVYTANQTNYNAKGLILFFDVTVASGTGGLTFWLSIPDPSSVSVPQAKLNATAITSISAGAIAIYPGLNTAPTGISDIVNMAVPRIFNIYVQAGDSTSYTYSLGYALIN